MYEVMHSGGWLPVWAWSEESPAWARLFEWVNDQLPDVDGRLIVTPKLADQLGNHSALRAIGKGALRQDGRGNGPGRDWVPGAGPIFIVWPEETVVQRCVQLTAGMPNQTIVLLEQAVASNTTSFAGWAETVGAFDADSGANLEPDSEFIDSLDFILTGYENELQAPPREDTLRARMRELQNSNQDTDFVVTSAIALGYQGDLKRLRQHYEAVVV